MKLRVVIPLLALWVSLLPFAAFATDGFTSQGFQEREAKALLRSLSFVRGLPDASAVNIAVIYSDSAIKGKAEAEEVVRIFNGIKNVGNTPLGEVTMVERSRIDGNADDAHVFFVTGMNADGFESIFDYAEKNHIFTMSVNEKCVRGTCCILSAILSDKVEILINKQVMSAIGYDFDAAFKFIAKQI